MVLEPPPGSCERLQEVMQSEGLSNLESKSLASPMRLQVWRSELLLARARAHALLTPSRICSRVLFKAGLEDGTLDTSRVHILRTMGHRLAG